MLEPPPRGPVQDDSRTVKFGDLGVGTLGPRDVGSSGQRALNAVRREALLILRPARDPELSALRAPGLVGGQSNWIQ